MVIFGALFHDIGKVNDFNNWKDRDYDAINGNSMDSYFESAHNIIRTANQGELYKIGNAPRSYYKSLNEYYNK